MTLLGELRKSLASLVIRVAESRPSPPPIPPGYIDPSRLAAEKSVEEHRAAAEEYFARLTDHDDLIAKPFAHLGETPQILINFAVLLQGMNLAPGMTVLDFAAGSCWATRIFTELGCRAIALDVSPSALEIGRELFRRNPVAGAKPSPQFLPFDGRHIDLPDGSVDRIFCFDAFHHLPNPGEVLREMARVLRDGGIAAFAEPGPHHSRSAESQFEMRQFGVLEGDIDIDSIWRSAREAGFTSIELALFSDKPYRVSLEDHRRFLHGEVPALEYLTHVRVSQMSVRDFFLRKGDGGPADSRRTEGLAAGLEVAVVAAGPGETPSLHVRVENRGSAHWLAAGENPGGVWIGAHLHDASGNLVDFEFFRAAVPATPPGAAFETTVPIPSLGAGQYRIELDLVAEGVTWFHQARASQPAMVEFEVVGGRPT